MDKGRAYKYGLHRVTMCRQHRNLIDLTDQPSQITMVSTTRNVRLLVLLQVTLLVASTIVATSSVCHGADYTGLQVLPNCSPLLPLFKSFCIIWQRRWEL